jgi:hypothetical protein
MNESVKEKSVMMKTFRSSTREVFHGSDREPGFGYNTLRIEKNSHTHYPEFFH